MSNTNANANANAMDGGAKRRSRRRASAAYTKTTRKYVGRDGVKRTVYVKDGKSYVKKRSSKTGKLSYRQVKA